MNGIRQEVINTEFHEHQMRALQSPARFVLLIAGTQGGKTSTGKWWIAREINEHPEDEYLVACPTYKIMGQSTLPRLLEVLKQMRCGTWNEQRKEFQLNGGGKVYVRSTEDPDAIESMKCRAVWLDEAGKMKVRVWYAVNSRIAILKGRVIMTTSPYNMGWIYSEIYKKSKDPDYEIIQFSSNANPWYPKDEYERQRRTLPELEFRRRFCGEFVKAEGLVYTEFDRSKNVVEPGEIDVNKLFKFCGLDIGFTAPTACVLCGIDANGTIYIYDEYYKANGLLGEHASNLREKGVKNEIQIHADKSAAQEIAELRHQGLNVIPGREIDVNLGINKIKALFKQGKLKISSKCTYLIDELETYAWKNDENDEGVDKVVKKKDHLVDAMRYGVCNTKYTLPGMTIKESYVKPQVIYDKLTGMPLGYGRSNGINLMNMVKGHDTVLMSDGSRLNLVTGKRTYEKVAI